MKKLALLFVLAVLMVSCTSKVNLSDKTNDKIVLSYLKKEELESLTVNLLNNLKLMVDSISKNRSIENCEILGEKGFYSKVTIPHQRVFKISGEECHFRFSLMSTITRDLSSLKLNFLNEKPKDSLKIVKALIDSSFRYEEQGSVIGTFYGQFTLSEFGLIEIDHVVDSVTEKAKLLITEVTTFYYREKRAILKRVVNLYNNSEKEFYLNDQSITSEEYSDLILVQKFTNKLY